jgi:hypothetical protein
MARPKKSTTEVPAPGVQEIHPLICPFSGQPMEIKMVGADVYFMVVSPHGFTSQLMKSRDECMEWASHRMGKQTYTAPRIEIREITPPDFSAEEGLREIAPNPDAVNDEDLPESLR